MILAAKTEGSLAEVLIIAAALSLQDPRERPLERAGAADPAQARFDDEKSDFLAYLSCGSGSRRRSRTRNPSASWRSCAATISCRT